MNAIRFPSSSFLYQHERRKVKQGRNGPSTTPMKNLTAVIDWKLCRNPCDIEITPHAHVTRGRYIEGLTKGRTAFEGSWVST